MNTIQQSIKTLENITPDRITKETEYVDSKGKACLVGEIVWKHIGFNPRGQVMERYPEIFGDDCETITNKLSFIHMQYTNNRINFDEMKKQAIKYMKSLLPKRSRKK